MKLHLGKLMKNKIQIKNKNSVTLHGTETWDLENGTNREAGDMNM